ncbi:hypothetical protein K0M31_008498 [Melipona bicolor]|uniref:Uncharacterized protein n=1 Tax=Melipona bicolor TaxID=60889 RepID=A0AA40FR49_9HYME|nr:hypothetical protein K0M31_008498 [Melipona bicolor]
MDQKNGWLAKRRCTKATTSEQLGGGERKKREERFFADILGSLEHNTSAITRAWMMVKLGSVLVGIKVRKPVVCMYRVWKEELSHPVLLLPVYFLLGFCWLYAQSSASSCRTARVNLPVLSPATRPQAACSRRRSDRSCRT